MKSIDLTMGNSGGFNRELRDLLSVGSHFIWKWGNRAFHKFVSWPGQGYGGFYWSHQN